jgi:predicted glycosyltransferase
MDNYYFVEYSNNNLNDTLHDQLFLSDLSIVFGSTVALDSKWMNVPCITYERREESLVYCIDNDWIYHVKSLDELHSKMNELLAEKKVKSMDSSKSVSGNIIEELNKAFDEVL